MISKLCNVFEALLFFWTTGCLFSQRVNALQTINDNTGDNSVGSSFFFYQQSKYPRDCREVQDQCSSHNSTGVFMIKPDSYLEPFEVYCDNADSSGGWTVIQRRIDGSIDFSRDWDSYKSGFGFLSQEFWLGNERLSYLTNQKKYQLVIEMTSSHGSLIRVSYDNFRISDEFSNFKLFSLGNFSGRTDVITLCPYNMVYRNCSNSCQRTCGAPEVCQDGVCNEAEACVCSDGYFMKGSDCVPQEQCGCYESEGQTVIPEGGSYVNPGCTRKGVCTNGQITWDEEYACHPKDCHEIYEDGSVDNDIYRIKPTGWTGEAFEVYCNMSDGGGWTVFQRRVDGTEDFYLGWDSYKEGFGELDHEFWLGNDKLANLTNQKRYEIRIDLVNRDGSPYYAKFDNFRINDESDKYRLSQLGTYSGTADSRSNPDGNALRYQLNHQFTTKDSDNDAYSGNCAVLYHGAWWYKACGGSRLNGNYHASRDSESSPTWAYLPGSYYNIKYSEMKIRPF